MLRPALAAVAAFGIFAGGYALGQSRAAAPATAAPAAQIMPEHCRFETHVDLLADGHSITVFRAVVARWDDWRQRWVAVTERDAFAAITFRCERVE